MFATPRVVILERIGYFLMIIFIVKLSYMSSASSDKNQVDNCPGYINSYSSYIKLEMPNNSTPNFCLNTPIRKFTINRNCLKIPRNQCTTQKIIDVCYPSYPCPNGYHKVMKTINRENTRTGIYILSVSMCCN
jgi:hypothetical protein